MKQKSIFWFRSDLRISDNPGLHEAAQTGKIMAVYILDEDIKLGTNSLAWLESSLHSLNESLKGNLNFYRGNSKEIILKLVDDYDITSIYWNRSYEPLNSQKESTLKHDLEKKGIDCYSFNSSLLWEPETLLKEDKTPYKVFTPFYKNASRNSPSPRIPLPKPKNLDLVKNDAPLTFSRTENVKGRIAGEDAALNNLKNFLEHKVIKYKFGRNYPSQDCMSRLSPYLHFGEISPNRLYYATLSSMEKNPDSYEGGECFLKEIAWREFFSNMLYHFPDLPNQNFQDKFNNFPWRQDPEALKAWQNGKTGYPLVDAGMRELIQTGYMHNRVRMIVGSFLVKNLLIDWREGAKWFWDHLVDADLANNSANWQWVAGCGADAAPYFRIFNPVTQGEKFDADGLYTKEYVPELSSLQVKYLFKPWAAPESVLKKADISLGVNYPKPIVELDFSRNRALEAFRSISKHRLKSKKS